MQRVMRDGGELVLVDAEGGIGFEEGSDLVLHHASVGAEVLHRESGFDEFLLFHEDGIGNVEDDVLAEYRDG